MSEYTVKITRSLLDHYTWDLLNGQGKSIASSQMFTRKENCEVIAKKLARALKCSIEKYDMNKDFEE